MSTSERPRHRGAGQRAGLSREQVLAAARRIADAEGVDRLTMRRLAAELGVLPNALYTYVPDKEALLDALIDDLLAGIEADEPAAGDWREGLASHLAGPTTDRQFHTGLRWLLDGIAAQSAQTG